MADEKWDWKRSGDEGGTWRVIWKINYQRKI